MPEALVFYRGYFKDWRKSAKMPAYVVQDVYMTYKDTKQLRDFVSTILGDIARTGLCVRKDKEAGDDISNIRLYPIHLFDYIDVEVKPIAGGYSETKQ